MYHCKHEAIGSLVFLGTSWSSFPQWRLGWESGSLGRQTAGLLLEGLPVAVGCSPSPRYVAPDRPSAATGDVESTGEIMMVPEKQTKAPPELEPVMLWSLIHDP